MYKKKDALREKWGASGGLIFMTYETENGI